MPIQTPSADEAEKPPIGPFGRVNIFFRLAAGLVVLFVVTIFALIAVLFGDPAAPIAKLLDKIGMQLIVGEMCAILIMGTLAMTIDRRSAAQASTAYTDAPVKDETADE